MRKLFGALVGYAVLALTVTQPVSVSLTSPLDGSIVSNTVSLSVNVSSSVAPIDRVEYYLDGVLIAVATNPIDPPPSLTLNVINQ